MAGAMDQRVLRWRIKIAGHLRVVRNKVGQEKDQAFMSYSKCKWQATRVFQEGEQMALCVLSTDHLVCVGNVQQGRGEALSPSGRLAPRQ